MTTCSHCTAGTCTSLTHLWRAALASPSTHARATEALALFDTLYPAPRIARVGMDTFSALAIRAHSNPHQGPDSTAAREYMYRWSLALRSPIFGVPHTLGL